MWIYLAKLRPLVVNLSMYSFIIADSKQVYSKYAIHLRLEDQERDIYLYILWRRLADTGIVGRQTTFLAMSKNN